jgi:glycosyltransferase involved in cell wall biosynthesis
MIVYDLQAVQSPQHGERGIARYVAELASALDRNHDGVVDVFAYNDHLPRVDRLERFGFGDRLRPFSSLRGSHLDLVHVNSPFERLVAHELMIPAFAERIVTTCYDLIPHLFPHVYLRNPATRSQYASRLQLLLVADEIVTDSESAARDVARMLDISPDRLTSLGAGVSPDFTPRTTPLADRLAQLQRAIPDLRAGFILAPSGMDWRKNVEGAMEAYAALPSTLRRRHQLVIACRQTDSEAREVDSARARLGIADDEVVATGYVSDPDLVALYQSAHLVFFPSYYEGFGLPVLEARRCGARVICSNTSSLPEVLPDQGALFNPYDRAEMSAMLLAALTDEQTIERLEAVPDPGFSWDLAADRLVEVYARALARPQRRRQGRSPDSRPRIAVVTMLPPTQSGVADHSVRLLAEMSRIAHVLAVVVDDAARYDGDLPYEVVGLRTLPSRWIAGEFDHVLYCMGNNPLHARFLPMLDRVPGSILVHDVRLVGAVCEAEHLGIWRRDADDPCEPDEWGNDVSYAIRSVARRARSVLVQSSTAADLVRANTGIDVFEVGPHPFPGEVAVSPPEDAVNQHHLVVSAGIASSTKASDVVADALEIVSARRNDTAGLLVGPDSERFVDEAEQPKVGEAVTGRVAATGAVSDLDFDRWLADATVAIQLRAVSNGESSGVVAQTLARGIPTVVSDAGAMAELPGDAVIKVPVDVSADELADVVDKLLNSPAERARLRSAALDLARRETYAVQAQRIVDVITQSAG